LRPVIRDSKKKRKKKRRLIFGGEFPFPASCHVDINSKVQGERGRRERRLDKRQGKNRKNGRENLQRTKKKICRKKMQ
jgi:hypothetical protein